MSITMDQWGADHWSTLAYVETRCVDHRGVLRNDHMRTDPARHPLFLGRTQRRSALPQREYPTRLRTGERRLDAARSAPSAEGVAVGDEVIACFTNSGNDWRFHGRIVGRTINVWKVETLGDDAPYGEAPGRVFQIPVVGRPRWSARNRVYRLGKETA